jgi:hypothetical protein
MLQSSQVRTGRCTMTVPVGDSAFVNVNSNKVLEVKDRESKIAEDHLPERLRPNP